MKYILLGVSITLLAGCGLEDIIDSENKETKVSGVVTSNNNGSIISGVLVNIDGKKTNSSDDGFYQLQSLNSGSQNVTASKLGYQDYSSTVTVTESETTSHDILLIPLEIFQWSSTAGGNDHYYQVVKIEGGVSWEAAKDLALLSGGYLATPTSDLENEFVYSLIKDDLSLWADVTGAANLAGPWIGGYQTTEVDGPAENWSWVNNEGGFEYTAWADLEPNQFQGRSENYLLYMALSSRWNDGTNEPDGTDTVFKGVVSYVVEYDSIPEANFIGCEKIKLESTSFTVACNVNTALGYYWEVGDRLETYGYWGLTNSEVEPSCNSETVGRSAQTAAWSATTSTDGFWTVYSDWCKTDATGAGQETLNPKCSSDTGRDFGACGDHCGIYEAICKKIN